MRLLLPVALLCLALLLAKDQRAQAQDKPVAREVHLGAGSCAAQACHGGAVADRMEYKVWATEDEHRLAYEHLSGSLGKRIGERLGIDPTRAEECLSCHGTVGVELAKTFDMADGVSCELCHGGARDWLGPHATPEWQRLSAADKEKRGLRDLSTPTKRVQACMGCHVGEPGRDITHAIMAAGHPPLIFDAGRYLKAMPPHWKDERDLTVASWLVGLKESASARLRRAARSGGGRPDFTLFDCDSCHHSVYTGSEYEKHDPPGRPGNLPLELSDLAVLLIAMGEPGRPLTHDPRTNGRDLAARAKALAQEVAQFAGLQGQDVRANLAGHLARVAAGTVRTPRSEMRQIAFAIEVLTGKRSEELEAALDPKRAYDAVACAKLARQAIGG